MPSFAKCLPEGSTRSPDSALDPAVSPRRTPLFSSGTSFLSPLKTEQAGLIHPVYPVNSTILECSRALDLSRQSGAKSLSHISGWRFQIPHLGIQELSLFFRPPRATAQTLTWRNSQCPRKTPYSCLEDTEEEPARVAEKARQATSGHCHQEWT